jgi:hypothetical protein
MFPIHVNRACTGADGSFVRVVELGGSAGVALSGEASQDPIYVATRPQLPTTFARSCCMRRNVTGDRAVLRTPSQLAVLELPTAASLAFRVVPPPVR